MWYTLIHIYLQIKSPEFSQACISFSDFNQQTKLSNIVPLLIKIITSWHVHIGGVTYSASMKLVLSLMDLV